METYPVNSRLYVASSQEAQGITRVHSQATVQRLRPLPLTSLVVTDLKRRDRLAEEQSNSAKVSVAARPKTVAELVNLFLRELGVLHVAKVRLIVGLPLVNLGKEVLGKL